jgi:hypothetical protein
MPIQPNIGIDCPSINETEDGSVIFARWNITLEHHFQALLTMVQPHICIKEASNTQMRCYHADAQLMGALFFLVHCTTLRVVADVILH